MRIEYVDSVPRAAPAGRISRWQPVVVRAMALRDGFLRVTLDSVGDAQAANLAMVQYRTRHKLAYFVTRRGTCVYIGPERPPTLAEESK